MVNTGLFHVLLRPPGLQSRSLFVCYRSACARPFLTLGLYCTVFLAPCQEAILAIFCRTFRIFPAGFGNRLCPVFPTRGLRGGCPSSFVMGLLSFSETLPVF